MLQVENLTVYYQTLKGQVRALENASFTLADGEIMGLAGESGCGKTTLGHSLIHLSPPMTHIGGRVLLNGQELPLTDMQKMDAYRFNEISIIPQYAMNALNPIRKIGPMTEELLRAKKADVRTVMAALKDRLEMVKLPQEVLGLYPIELSGGQKQRVAICRCLAMDPDIILFDEPTSALDPEMIKEVLDIMRDLAVSGTSMICVTHELGFAKEVANRIVFMEAGKVVEENASAEFFERPKSLRTRRFIDQILKV